MRVLITGGCGFLGSNIAARLLPQKQPVMVFDNLSRLGATQNQEWLRSQGAFEFMHGDVRSTGDVDAAVKAFSPDIVFHLAGQVAMTTSLERPRLDFEINAMGTLNVLEALRSHAPRAGIVYSSTNKVYGDLEHLRFTESATRYEFTDLPEGVPETATLDFHSPYGCSKGAADQYILDYARMFGVKGTVFRHSSMYGGRQFATYDQGWMGWFCQKAVEQAGGSTDDFTVSGNGKQVRDLLHAQDVVDLYLRAAERIDTVSGEAFNIGGGRLNSLSVLELLTHLGEQVGRPLTFRHIARRESDQRVFVADIAKARRLLDWEPRVGWRDGVQRMIDWCRSTESRT